MAPSDKVDSSFLLLSRGQRALWSLYEMSPDSGAYNVSYAWHVRSTIDAGALRTVLERLAVRHPTHRATYEVRGGEVGQVVHDQVLPIFEEIPADAWNDRDVLAELEREVYRPYALTEQPPVRWRLYYRRDDDPVLVLGMHHVGCDGWSVVSMLHELRDLYAAETSGVALTLPELPLNSELVRQQEDMLTGDAGAAHLAYWKKRLGGELPDLDLSTDFPRPLTVGVRRGLVRRHLGRPLTDALLAWAKELGVSPFKFFLSAYQVFLWRYTGQRENCVGVVTAGRGPELAGVFNCFVNTVPIRARFDGDPSFREFLESHASRISADLKHRDYPFSELANEILNDRDPSRAPICQTDFFWESYNDFEKDRPSIVTLDENLNEWWDLGEVRLERIFVNDTLDHLDLDFKVVLVAERFYLFLEYNSELFSRETIQRLAGHFECLLKGLASDAAISELPLLSDSQRSQLLVEWNDTGLEIPAEKCLHRLFEKQAARTPDRVAITCGRHCLTYGELGRRADRLASSLRGLGVAPDIRVGLCVERGVDMVAGVLAILEAGGAYVPLDPSLPAERLAFMIEDAGASVLVTQRRLMRNTPAVAQLRALYDGPLVFLDVEPAASVAKAARPEVAVRPENLAYVIYTSGSTGRPKGVEVSHRSVVNLLAGVEREPGLGAGDALLAVSTLAFDIAAVDLFLPLTVGAKLVVAPSAAAADGEWIASLLADARISFLQATPATWSLLLEAGWKGRPGLTVVSTGEALPPSLAESLQTCEQELWDFYGPTEATVWAAGTRLTGTAGDLSIGRPLANVQVYVLDRHLQPVPQGAIGELYLGGAGLARGYRRRPALTAERFVPDPFFGSRLYRTGDRARFDPQGRLHFLGRADHQIKLRGFRIEPAEIETELERHPAVERTLVLMHGETVQDRRLVAYLTALDGEAPGAAELRDFLAEALPDNMVPSTFVSIDALPLSPSGKIDRGALAEILTPAAEPAGLLAPRSPVEEAVAGAFSEILRRESVGAQDHFFQLGGHSLLATQLLARLRHLFEVDLQPTAVFESPTVAALAERISSARGLAARAPLRQPIPTGKGGDPPLSFAQQRLWFLDRMGAGAGYNIPAFFRIQGALDREALVRSIDHIVGRHAVLRTTFPTSGGKPLLVIARELEVPLEIVDRVDLPAATPEAAIDMAVATETAAPFDLARGPLIRAKLVRLEPTDHLLLLTFHHIVMDGWSLDLFARELTACYEALARDREPSLPQLPVQYADYAAWQRAAMEGEVLRRQLEDWLRQLRDPPALALPTDRPRPAVQTFRGSARRLEITAPLAAACRALEHRAGVSETMLLLAAFEILLARYCGQDEVVVGTPIANRGHPEVENLIGLFVNTLVLRTDLSGDPSFLEVLRRVRRASLAAYDRGEVPLERLVAALRLERDTSLNPLFQVGFALRNRRRVDLDLPQLSIRPVETEVTTARLDLELHLAQDEEGLSGRLIYNPDLFDDATIDRMAYHYVRLLQSAVEAPEAPVASLSLLEAHEAHALLVEWHRTAAPFSAGPVHELVAARAREAPNAVAVAFGREALTYRQLDGRAGRVARVLRRSGVGPEVVVGLCTERSPQMIVALLGILKAGGAYLPLDPAHPGRRLAFMLEDSDAPILLTQERLLATLPPLATRTLCIGEDGMLRAPSSVRNRPATGPAAVGSDALAYVTYTSGSTGTPKGTAVTHRGLCNVAARQREAFGAGPGGRVLQFSSPSYDASTFEIVMALTHGATLVLAAPEAMLLGRELVELIRRQRVSIVTLPPTALKAMPATALPELETITVAGEACPEDVVARWAPGRRSPGGGHGRPFFNLYGPTEATIWSTAARLAAGAGPVHVGRPIANVETYVLDRRLRPVPAGVVGELHLGGVGLARGYLGRPGRTAASFVPNPFAAEPGERLYATGDLARHRGDGALELVGRRDQQVKVRGHRIELGEVEAAIARLLPAADVAVLCREDRAGEKRLVAYLAGGTGRELSRRDLRRALGESLPEFMIPSALVRLDHLPLTAGGKVDRRALPAPGGDRAASDALVSPRGELERRLAAIWCDLLEVDRVGVDDEFFALGGHSIRLVELQARLADELGCELPMVDLFRYPTVEALAERIAGDAPQRRQAETAGGAARPEDGRIAVIGLACRFPGAPDVETFWPNLRDGVESVRSFSDEELRQAGVDERTIADPAYVKARATLEDADLFDARYFGYTPREAEIMDPQHRVFLECAHEALERAGCDPERYGGRVGVWAGASTNSYLANVASHPARLRGAALQVGTGNHQDFLATRVSYKLNLRGPSLTVQTACSTSLVAIHEGCEALRGGRCDMALAGGVSISVPLAAGYTCDEGGIASPDGHCRPFDARGQGTVPGDGAGVVVLKRLAEALRDGDQIHAVILGSATNNDGSAKVGYTAPSITGQAEVVHLAQAAAGVAAETVGVVEAHGTATPLGDPIEVAALTSAFRQGSSPEAGERRGTCALGSVKSNLGHLDAAAGVAGLIKAVLALRHRHIPPSLHFERPNPEIDFDDSPFYVPASGRGWQAAGDVPRRAGVSSFGIGGTNAHAVLEEAPAAEPSGGSRRWQLLTLSARSETALEAAAKDLASHLRRQPSIDVADVAHTLQVGRRELELRRAVACRDVDGAAAALEGGRPALTWTRRAVAKNPPVIFLFPGHGHQYVDMGLGLYRSEEVFRQAVDECLAQVAGELDFDLRAAMFPRRGTNETVPENERDAAQQTLMSRPLVFQPAIFIVDYALARLWQSWGVEPAACLGHSLGEYVAAAVCGVLSPADALRLVVLRGRLMELTPPGAMLSVALAEKRAAELVADRDGKSPLSPSGGTWLCSVNAPELCVVAGEPAAIEELGRRLAARGTECDPVPTAYAYHSGMMESGVGPLRDAVAGTPRGTPRIPYLSNTTGGWITEELIRDPEYWGRHLAAPVRFSANLELVLRDPGAVLLEVGPGRMLSSLARKHPTCGRDRVVASSLRHPQSETPDELFLTEALARLWTGGVTVDWQGYRRGERRRRVVLPTYPFQRQRFWVDRRAPAPAASPGKRADLSSWFYAPVWRRSRWAPELADRNAESRGTILVFTPDSGIAAAVVRGLRDSGRRVVEVRLGASYAEADGAFTIDVASGEDYRRLLTELARTERTPADVVHLWCVTFERCRPSDRDARKIQEHGLHSLLRLTRALARSRVSARIHVVTDGVCEVLGDEALCPEKATVLGPCRVAGLEHPNLSWRHVDLAGDAEESGATESVGALVREVLSPAIEPVVAFRRGRRWVSTLAPVPLGENRGTFPRRLRPRGRYLVIGGLGGIGRVLGEELARSVEARLVLVGRTPLPERARWEAHLSEHGGDHPVSRRIRAVEAIEAAGAEVMLVRADICDGARMEAVVAAAIERFGGLDGVVHLAAAASGGGRIEDTQPADVERELAPKMVGARVLERLFAAAELDFVLLASSIITSWALPGWAAYCAANQYLDVFAQRFAADTGIPTVALAWPRWRETGLAADLARQRGLSDLEGISNEEGVEIFRRVLDGGDEPQIVVSDVDFRQLSPTPRAGGPRTEPAAATALGEAHLRPSLSTEWTAPRNAVERTLAAIWQSRLGIERIGVDDNFFELGGDSVQAIGIAAAARAAGVVFTPAELLRHQTVAALAAASSTSPSAAAEQGPVVGPLPLTPMQRWYLEEDPVDADHFNMAFLLRPRDPLEPAAVAAALQALIRHHDGLRLRVRSVDGDWRAEIATPSEIAPFAVVDLTRLPRERRAPAVERAAARIQTGLDLASGPIVRAVLFRGAGEGADCLLLAVHHLAVDMVSWGILLEDLSCLLAGMRQCGVEPEVGTRLPPKTTSVRAWAKHLVEETHSEEVAAAAAGWLDLPWPEVRSLPRDRPHGENTFSSEAQVSAVLSADKTRALLSEVAPRLGAGADEILIAALGETVAGWTGARHVLADLDVQARDSAASALDLSRTVGWLTAMHPVLLRVEPAAGAAAFLAGIRRQLAWFRERRLTWGLARYLSPDRSLRSELRSLPGAEINFGYHGRADRVALVDSGFELTGGRLGAMRSVRAHRRHLLDVHAVVADDRLDVRWTYSRNVHAESTIRALCDRFVAALDRLLSIDVSRARRRQDLERFGWSAGDAAAILKEIEVDAG